MATSTIQHNPSAPPRIKSPRGKPLAGNYSITCAECGTNLTTDRSIVECRKCGKAWSLDVALRN